MVKNLLIAACVLVILSISRGQLLAFRTGGMQQDQQASPVRAYEKSVLLSGLGITSPLGFNGTTGASFVCILVTPENYGCIVLRPASYACMVTADTSSLCKLTDSDREDDKNLVSAWYSKDDPITLPSDIDAYVVLVHTEENSQACQHVRQLEKQARRVAKAACEQTSVPVFFLNKPLEVLSDFIVTIAKRYRYGFDLAVQEQDVIDGARFYN